MSFNRKFSYLEHFKQIVTECLSAHATLEQCAFEHGLLTCAEHRTNSPFSSICHWQNFFRWKSAFSTMSYPDKREISIWNAPFDEISTFTEFFTFLSFWTKIKAHMCGVWRQKGKVSERKGKNKTQWLNCTSHRKKWTTRLRNSIYRFWRRTLLLGLFCII